MLFLICEFKKLDKNARLANILSLLITSFINSIIQEHGCLILFMM